jgi:signal transduction histidine kinase
LIRLFLWACLWVKFAHGQPKKYHVSVLDADKEFIAGSVNCLHQERGGFVWIGMPGGLCRYDGNQYRVFRDEQIRPVDLVRTIVEDTKGNFWLGINKIKGFNESYTITAYFEKAKGRYIYVKEKTKNGWESLKGQPLALVGNQLWCLASTTGQLFYFDVTSRRKVVVLHKIPLFNDNNFYDHQSVYDGKRYLWIHLLEGILRFDTQTFQTCYLFSGHPANKLGKPTFFSNFKLTDKGLYFARKDDSASLLSYDFKSLQNAPPTQDFFAPHNSIIEVPDAHSPRFPYFKSFGDGVLWVWNYNYLYKLNPVLPKFQKITASTHNFPIKFSNRGFLTLNDSLLRVNMDEFKVVLYHTKTNQLSFPGPNDILNKVGGRTFRSTDGSIWIMARKGLSQYVPSLKKVITYLNPDTLQATSKFVNTIRDVFEVTSPQFILNTESGILLFDRTNHRFRRIPFFGTLGRVSLTGADGKLYVSLDGKLHIGYLQDTIWRALTPPIAGATFRNGFDDVPRQRILGATATGLLVISKTNWQFKKWTTKDGLASEYVYDVLPDDKGDLWISTARGLSRSYKNSTKVDNFQLSDGLQSYDFNSRTAFIMPDGEMYFGGSRGFNRFYPEDVRLNHHLSKPYLTDFMVKDKPYPLPADISGTKGIDLPPNINTFAIHYSTIDFFSEGVNSYQYRLLGSDSTWIDANTQTVARFVQLPAGQYTFELRSANSDGYWTPTPAHLEIVIAPYFWQTLWFRSLLAIAFLGALYGIYYYRVRRLRKQQRKEIELIIQTQEKERSRFTKEVHDGIGANLTALKIMVGLLGKVEAATLKSKLEGVLDATFEDLRGLINDMSPRNLKNKGLVKALVERATLINQVQHLNVTVQATPGFPQSLPDEYEVNLYRIAQELLQNTLKHAEATEAMLQLDCFDNTLLMRYSDNGKGFDFAQIQQKNGNGIANLHARVQLLNGTLQINTAPQQGMNVAIQIPYKSTFK